MMIHSFLPQAQIIPKSNMTNSLFLMILTWIPMNPYLTWLHQEWNNNMQLILHSEGKLNTIQWRHQCQLMISLTMRSETTPLDMIAQIQSWIGWIKPRLKLVIGIRWDGQMKPMSEATQSQTQKGVSKRDKINPYLEKWKIQ